MKKNQTAVNAELIHETEGFLDSADWKYQFYDEKQGEYLPSFKEHYYLWFRIRMTGVDGIPVCFHEGKLQFISTEEMKRDGADKPYPHRFIGENANYEQLPFPARLRFADTAPPAYRGKELLLPRGMHGLGFDGKGRLVLFNGKGSFAVMDENMNMSAKCRLKGNIRDIDGDYILTEEEKDFSGILRVYKISEK